MASIRRGSAMREIQTLYRAGTCSGLTDGQLLERFLAGPGERAEAAFTILIERHGPMVLRICRAVLRDEHDAEDAFQATFLVLAQRAASIRCRGSLGSWLFGVASRVARCARTAAARRRWHERRRAEDTPEAVAGLATDDLESVIQAEVDRLPERLRAAVVLCYFEGQTCEQAADRLRLPVGTIKSRLSGARARLRSRLARSGYAPDEPMMLAWPLAGSVVVPPRLSSLTLGCVMASGGAVSVPAIALAKGVLRAMFFSRLKVAAALAAVIAALTWISVVMGAGRSGQASVWTVAAPAAKASALPGQEKPGERVLARGRVVDPDGRPVEGASVRLMFLGNRSGRPGPRTTSGPDGRFVLSEPKETPDRTDDGTPRVVATAEGFGLGWADPGDREDLTVRLVADVPIEGRIVDAQGWPIAGVKVKTHNAWASPNEDLASFIDEVKRYGRTPWEGARPLKLVAFDATAMTDADGRFRLTGFGRERVAALDLSGPTIVSEEVYAMTRVSPAVGPVGWERLQPNTRSYRGARFEHKAAACLPITGIVRDAETGRPIAGVKVHGGAPAIDQNTRHPDADTTTDDQGRYTLTGLPPGSQYWVSAASNPGLSYVGRRSIRIKLPTPAMGPLQYDIRLRKGALIRGRVTDSVTGRPVPSAVVFHPFHDSPRLDEYGSGSPQYTTTDDEGRFEMAIPPGRGVLAAQTRNWKHLPIIDANTNASGIQGLDQLPALSKSNRSNVVYHAIAEIRTTTGGGPVTQDLKVVASRRLTGMVLDPEGQPVAETVAMGIDGSASLGQQVLIEPEFTIENVDSRRPRRLQVFQVERRLAGSVWIGGDEAGPITVRLQPWGVVTGRIIDQQGKSEFVVLTGDPRGRTEPDSGLLPRRTITGRDGRFRIEGLVPGLRYSAVVLDDMGFRNRRAFHDLRVGPGETRDLGDIRLEHDDPANKD